MKVGLLDVSIAIVKNGNAESMNKDANLLIMNSYGMGFEDCNFTVNVNLYPLDICLNLYLLSQYLFYEKKYELV